jgi:hypothetical protein
VNEIGRVAEAVSAGFTRVKLQRPLSNEAQRIVASSEKTSSPHRHVDAVFINCATAL